MQHQHQNPDLMASLAEESMQCGNQDHHARLLQEHEAKFQRYTIDFYEAELLRQALSNPSSWAWDPQLQALFHKANQKYFDGQVQPHRLLWFDVSMLPEQLPQHMWARLAYLTHGYRTDGDLGKFISLNARLKLHPTKLNHVLRHEMTHDIAGHDAGHGPEFIQALRKQGQGEDWVQKEVLRYTARNRVQTIIQRALIRDWQPGESDLAEVQKAIQEHGLSHEELGWSIDSLSPGARTLVLQAVRLR